MSDIVTLEANERRGNHTTPLIPIDGAPEGRGSPSNLSFRAGAAPGKAAARASRLFATTFG